MRVLLIYYTGTYNTRYLTHQVKERFCSLGWDVDAVEITVDTPPVCTDGYALIGFSYPIYGFNTPRPFDRYVKQLRISKMQRYFIYKNSGETMAMNNASSRLLLHQMKRKGARFVGEYHYVMPYNIHFPYERPFVRQILQQNQKLLDIMMHNLMHGRIMRIQSNPIYNLASFFVSIQKIGGDINSFLYRVKEEKCTHCGKCIRDCPNHNIYEKHGKIRFHHHCDMCMRCSFYCPANAISIGFLESWKVNGAYPFQEIEADDTIVQPYITKDSRGFYRCFVRSFYEIDREHDRLFSHGSKD